MVVFKQLGQSVLRDSAETPELHSRPELK